MQREPIVGDRFVQTAPGEWTDLATGLPVEVVVRELADWVNCARECDAELAAPRRAGPWLIDYGRGGVARSFVARSRLVTPLTGHARQRADRIASEVAASVASRANGVGYLDVSPPAGSVRYVACAIARAVRPAGFVAVRSDVRVPDETLGWLLHRHVVVLAGPGAGTEMAVWWVRELSRISSRAHLVVALRAAEGRRSRRSGPVFAREAAGELDHITGGVADWETRVRAASSAASNAIAGLRFDSAESILSALESEAAIREWPVPDCVRVRRAELAVWRGQFEEAELNIARVQSGGGDAAFWRAVVRWASSPGGEAPRISRASTPGEELVANSIVADRHLARGEIEEARGVLGAAGARSELAQLLIDWLHAGCDSDDERTAAVAARIRRRGALGILRWGIRREQMHVLHALPALLQIVHDADDDLAALTGGCRWLARYAGADCAAVVAADGVKVVAAHGCTPADIESQALAAGKGITTAATTIDGTTAVTKAPVLSGGTAFGYVVARGSRAGAGTLEQGAAAVAALTAAALRSRLDAMALITDAHNLVPELIGRSPAIAGVRESIARAAAAAFPVLIEGESGTGKELVARALHRLSRRRDRHFCAINCAALTDELVEAELFGYARGAFTGAVGPRAGLFEEAHGGTLFLDEVAELSARAQAKLLRALQEREIRRLGENAARSVDVRVITATNRALTDAVGRLAFREDLLFRLAVVRIRLPPLRHRLEDVPVLAQAFWRRLTGEAGKRASLSHDCIARLCRHQWRGNVRELQNTMAALVVAAPVRGRVTARQVDQVIEMADARDAVAAVPLEAARRTCEQRTIAAALARHGGRRTAAARELGLTRQGLVKAIKRLGLDTPRGTAGVA